MRLTTIFCLAAGLSVALCAPASLQAQQPGLQAGPKPNPLDPSKMPTDKLLAFAIAHNGAGEVPGEGWHLKGTFEYNTSQLGDTRFANGSFDETWYGPQNYSKTYEYKGVRHTDTATPDGLFRSGDQGWDTPEEVMVRHLLVSPIPTDPLDPNITLMHQDMPTGRATVPCLFEVYKTAPDLSPKEQKEDVDHSPRLCFDPAAPILRFSAGIGSQVEISYSKIANLHGHLVAQEISVSHVVSTALGRNDPVPLLRIHVQEASVPPDPTGPMAIPGGAQKLVSPVTVAWETVALNRLPEPRSPVYPAGAIQEHLTGEVNIAIVISPDGTVTSAKVVDGIQMLRDTALDFIKQSKFKPFTLSGTPVEVHTIAHVNYGGGGGGAASSSGRKR